MSKAEIPRGSRLALGSFTVRYESPTASGPLRQARGRPTAGRRPRSVKRCKFTRAMRHYDVAIGAHVVARGVLVEIVTDAGAGGDNVVTNNDGAPEFRAFADHRVIHDDAVFELGPFFYDYLAPDHRVVDARAVDEHAAAENAVLDVADDDLGDRPEVIAGEDGPLAIENIEARFEPQHVLMSGEVRLDGADVAPVRWLFICFDAGYPVGGEVIGIDALRRGEHGQDEMAEIVLRPVMRFFQCFDQRFGTEQIIAHRREAARRIIGHACRALRFFLKFAHASVGVCLDDPETGALRNGHRQCRDRDVGVGLTMELDHLADIHAVDVIGAEHGDDVGTMQTDQIQIFINGTGRAFKPAGAAAHLRRHDGDEMRGIDGRQYPGLAHVLDQRLRFVLHEKIDGVDFGIDEIAQHEIDVVFLFFVW